MIISVFVVTSDTMLTVALKADYGDYYSRPWMMFKVY